MATAERKFTNGNVVVGKTRGGWGFGKGRVEGFAGVDSVSDEATYHIVVLEGNENIKAGQVVSANERDIALYRGAVIGSPQPQPQHLRPVDSLEGSERRIEMRRERAAREKAEGDVDGALQQVMSRDFPELKNCGLPESAVRKMLPVGTLISQYFPDALLAVSAVAYVGNEKHNPGEPMHWARGKSDDHLECDARHLIDSQRSGSEWDVTTLKDGRSFAVLHLAQHAWRALALLQLEVERQGGDVIRVLSLAKEAQQVPLGGETR